MKIGVVSDTHDNLRNVERIIDIFNSLAVDAVVHTGDITQRKTLLALTRLRPPLIGVFGNNDLPRGELECAVRELGLNFADPPLRLEWAGRRIVVVHDPSDHEDSLLYSGDVLLHGHDHLRRLEQRNGTLVFNPGECAGHVTGLNSVGVLDLSSLDVEVLLF
jgi:putative phosphoesterase